MKRMFRVSCVLLVTLAVTTAGCKKGDKDAGKGKDKGKVSEPTEKKAPPPPVKMTPEQKATHYAKCWEHFAKKDKAAMGACYAENAHLLAHDHLPPVDATGRNEVVAALEGNFWNLFSDVTGEPQLMMVSGNKLVSIVLFKGTNSGNMGPMPATGKKVGLLVGAYTELDDRGLAARDEHWMDQNTIAGQLGLMPKEAPPTLPVMEEGWPEKVIAVAADDEKEQANAKLIATHFEAFNKHDVKAVLDTYADDVTIEIWGMPPTEGKKAAEKELVGYFAGFSDVKEEPLWTLAAGDYVALSCTSTGTFDGTMPGPPKMKGTGKKFATNDLNVFQITNGKIAHQWVFGNGYSWAMQLGLAPSPMELMKKAAGAPPAKGDAPAKKADPAGK